MFDSIFRKIAAILSCVVFIAANQLIALEVNEKVAAEFMQMRDEISYPPLAAEKWQSMRAPLQAIIEGGNVNAQDSEGKTALMHTAEGGDIEFLAYLLFKNADTTIKDNNGKTAADYAKDENIKEMLDADVEFTKELSDNEKNEIRQKHEKNFADSYLPYDISAAEFVKVLKSGWQPEDLLAMAQWGNTKALTRFILMIKGGVEIEPARQNAHQTSILIQCCTNLGLQGNIQAGMQILLLAGADPNIESGDPWFKTSVLFIPNRYAIGEKNAQIDRLLIAAGGAQNYIEKMKKVLSARKSERCIPTTKELFLRILDEQISLNPSLSADDKGVIIKAAQRYQDDDLVKKLAKRIAFQEADEDIATIAPKSVIKMAAFANAPKAHKLAKQLIKAKKWANTPADNFLLAIIAESPAEIKRTYKEIGSLAKFLEGCVPKKLGENAWSGTTSISPFAFIRNAEIAKLILSLEKNIIPVRVNWECMNAGLFRIYMDAKMDLPAESEKINWFSLSSDMIELLKNHDVIAPPKTLVNAAIDGKSEALEAFIKLGLRPNQSLLKYALKSEIEPCPKLELLVRHGVNVQDENYICDVLEKPEIVKTLLRLGAKKEEALKRVTAIIAQLENAVVGTILVDENKRVIRHEDYQRYCYVRDLLEGKAPLDAPSVDEQKPQGKKSGKISAKLQEKARKKLSALGIEKKDYNKTLKKVIACKTEADKKLAKILILAGADVKKNGSVYLKKAAGHPDVIKLLRIAGASDAPSPTKSK